MTLIEVSNLAITLSLTIQSSSSHDLITAKQPVTTKFLIKLVTCSELLVGKVCFIASLIPFKENNY